MMSKTDAQKKRSNKRIRNSVCTALACAALLLAQSCTDVFHELIPPSDSGIHSFSVENADRTRYRAAETDSTDITITVPAGTDITSLVPVIELDSKSTVIPVTLPYIHRAFPSADLMSLAVQMNASQKAGGLGNWMLNFIRENKDFSVPPLDEPVDFTQPVMFCIIAGRGNYKLYTVTVVPEKTENPADPENPSPSEPDNPYDPGTPGNPSVPPAAECEKKILSFVINEPKQTKPSVITEDTVAFYLNAGADSSALYPVITVSEGAGILPLTQEYLIRLFSYTELISFYSGFSSAKDTNAFISATVKKLDADKIAKIMEADLSLPIDFSGLNSLFGVPFAVIGADKTAHVYAISCVTAEDTAALTAFAVTKIRNPGLIGDADVSVTGDAVTVTATYPVEYQKFKLVPDIEIEGDTWEITDGTLRAEDIGTSGEEAEYTAGLKKAVYLVPGDAYPVGNEYTATLTVRRGEAAATYTLRLIYREDPDTIRSITDFRFLSLRNPGIKATSMASISKNEDTGFISAAVIYEGDEPPYDLVADFYSPGTCTVEHREQVSGKSRNNFQYDVQILCTSKNKLFCRLYTVHVAFIKVKTAEAVLNYFSFPKHLNPDLSQSATGLIDESSGTVYVNAKYHTPEKPARLVPEFAATGTVSVNSILQSSGYSAQDFSRSVYYSVRDQNDWSSDSRTYRVSVNWEQDEQSACAITGFGFSTADNPSLEKDVSARINERAGTIYALLPKGAGKSNLAPYFSAQGTITIGSAEQTSGGSRLDFSGEVIYTVTSANGLYSKQYAVSVQEAGPVIYVNAAAIGRNNGTCWQDAYITLDAAFEQAAAYGDANKEIWIAHNGGVAYEPLSDEYRQNGLPLTANTIIRGGFAGGETKEDERLRTKDRTEERKKDFDVKTVKTAKDDKGEIIYNTETTHYSIMEDAVCAVQTKLLQPNTDSHLFRTGTLSGEIEFDGIEMEATLSGKKTNCFLLYANDMQTATVSLIDCTVRCFYFSTRPQHIFVQNSDLYILNLKSDTIKATNSRFYAQPVDTTFISGDGEYENCYFSEVKQNQSYGFFISESSKTLTLSVKKCFFENVKCYSTSMLHAEECYFALKSTGPCFSFIKDCFIKTNSYIRWKKNINIENSYITTTGYYAFSKDSASREEPTKFSIKNSIVDSEMANDSASCCILLNTSSKVVIEMENSKITDFRQVDFNSRSPSQQEITMTNCSFYNEKETNYAFISLQDTNPNVRTVSIENCNFDLQNDSFIEVSKVIRHMNNDRDYDVIDGSLKIKHNNFKLKGASDEEDFHVYLSGDIEFTNNIIESESSQVINLISSDSVKFTNNKCYAQWTEITATNIKELADNTYDNFVMYNISAGNNNKQLDISTETITIKEPLYCDDNTPCTKKAFLNFSNGEIRIDGDKYKDFLCGLELHNATAIVKGQDFGNMPSFLNVSIPVSGSGSVLELTDCTVEGEKNMAAMEIDFTTATLTNCTVKGKDIIAGAIKLGGSLTVDNSEIKGDIRGIYWSSTPDIKLKSGSKVTAPDGYDDDVSGVVNGNNITVSEKSSAGSIYSSSGTITVSGDSTVGSLSARNITIEKSTVGSIASLGQNASIFCSESTVKSIRAEYGTVTLKGCTFNGSNQRYSAVTIGDAPSGKTATELIIDNCSFSNYTLDCPGSFGAGAAVFAKAKNVQIKNKCSFTNCTNKYDDDGGAVYIIAETVSIDNSHFTNNTAENWRGGAVYIDAEEVSLTGCTFTGNKNLETDAKQAGGGAVAISCSKNNVHARISDCTFTNNSAAVANRGIDIWMSARFTEANSENIKDEWSGCTLEISNSTINLTSNTVCLVNINQ